MSVLMKGMRTFDETLTIGNGQNNAKGRWRRNEIFEESIFSAHR